MSIYMKNINKKFGDLTILNNWSLHINTGEMIALTGPSGCGKTTLLNIMGLIDFDYSGEYKLNGHSMRNLNIKEQRMLLRDTVAMLFQNYALVDDETVEQNLAVSLYHSALDKKTKKLRMEEALKQVQLNADISNKPIYILSGGEQQRVAIARIILKKANLILADEPTGNLDKENERIVMERLRSFSNQGKTVVVVTHNEGLYSYFDRVINLVS